MSWPHRAFWPNPVGAQTQSIIDERHLGRMTLGDRSLEREVLEIFARQTVLMLERIAAADPARGRGRRPYTQRLGARDRRLARGAGGRTIGAGGRPVTATMTAIAAAIAELEAASFEVRAAIGARFGDHRRSPQTQTLSATAHATTSRLYMPHWRRAA